MSYKRKKFDKSEQESGTKKQRSEDNEVCKILCNPFITTGAKPQFGNHDEESKYFTLRQRFPLISEDELKAVWIHSLEPTVTALFSVTSDARCLDLSLVLWPGDALLADWLPNIIPSAGPVGIIREYARHFEMTREQLDGALARANTIIALVPKWLCMDFLMTGVEASQGKAILSFIVERVIGTIDGKFVLDWNRRF